MKLKRQYGVNIEEDLHRAVDSARVLIMRYGRVGAWLLKEIGTEKILRDNSGQFGSRPSALEASRPPCPAVRWRGYGRVGCRSGSG